MKGKASEKDKDVSENFQDMRVKQRQQESRICPPHDVFFGRRSKLVQPITGDGPYQYP